jgi:hypothetical protein
MCHSTPSQEQQTDSRQQRLKVIMSKYGTSSIGNDKTDKPSDGKKKVLDTEGGAEASNTLLTFEIAFAPLAHHMFPDGCPINPWICENNDEDAAASGIIDDAEEPPHKRKRKRLASNNSFDVGHGEGDSEDDGRVMHRANAKDAQTKMQRSVPPKLHEKLWDCWPQPKTRDVVKAEEAKASVESFQTFVAKHKHHQEELSPAQILAVCLVACATLPRQRQRQPFNMNSGSATNNKRRGVPVVGKSYNSFGRGMHHRDEHQNHHPPPVKSSCLSLAGRHSVAEGSPLVDGTSTIFCSLIKCIIPSTTRTSNTQAAPGGADDCEQNDNTLSDGDNDARQTISAVMAGQKVTPSKDEEAVIVPSEALEMLLSVAGSSRCDTQGKQTVLQFVVSSQSLGRCPSLNGSCAYIMKFGKRKV